MFMNKALAEVDAEGRTPLALAAHFKSDNLVRALLAARAQANVADSRGNTPLMLATAKGARHAVDRLLEARALLARQNADGFSAVDLAVGQDLRGLLQAQVDREAVGRKLGGRLGGSLPALKAGCSSGVAPRSCRLRLDGLPARHTPDHLEDLLQVILEEYDVAIPDKVEVVVDPITLKPCGHAYVSFATDREAQDAECTLREESNLRVSLEAVF